MGLYDELELPDGFSLPDLDADPSEVTWQTKSVGRPVLRQFQVTPDGRLLQAETHTEEVPEEDRPFYGTDKWPEFGFAGSIRTVVDGWSHRRYHGIVEFHASLDDRFASYEAKFDDGRLASLRNASGEDPGEWLPARDVLPDDGRRDALTASEVARLDALLDALVAELDAVGDRDGVLERAGDGDEGTSREQRRDVRDCARSIQTYLDQRPAGRDRA